MTFSKAFLDDLKERFRLSDVVGRTVKLTRAGREYKGLSPFTNERTPSFFVNDDKQFFHCFSSGESGDLITFVMKTRGLSFYEAVKLLADDAGVELPQQSPEERAREKERASLVDIMAMAAAFYAHQLGRRDNSPARAYLDARGLKPATIERFQIGYAPKARTALHDHLLQKDVTPDQMIEAGLVIKPDDGGALYDRFRHRVIFPITDFRGRPIAFGGRALDADGQPKYLNSPETSLFHKGALLYNFKNAREAVQHGGHGTEPTLIVAEGYMDVITLVEAGIDTAVAPLGTALTDIQLQTLWRVAPEPIVCLDGDRAGLAAAHRVVDRALPLLAAGQSLRFALLPEGLDPDDIVRGSGGVAAMRNVLAAAIPLADMLWQRETERTPADTPERRAGLESRLRELIATIGDGRVRAHYQADLRARLARLFNQPDGFRSGPASASRSTAGKPGISGALRRSGLTRGASGRDQVESLLVLGILNHPELLDGHHEVFAAVELGNAKLDRLRNEIIRIGSAGPLDRRQLHDHLSASGVAGLAQELCGRSLLMKDHPFVRPETAPSDAETGWSHLVNLHWGVDRLRRELREAEQALAHDMTDENFARLMTVRAQVHAAEQAEKECAAAGHRE